MGKITKRKSAEDGEIFSPPEILRDPTNKQIVLGKKISLRVMAKGMPMPSYQWYLNGQRINGANSDRFNIIKSRKEHQGAYTCEVKNSVGKIMSKPAMVTFFLDSKIELVLEPEAATRNEGESISIEVITKSKKVKAKELIWKFNGKIIPGVSGFKIDLRKLTKKHHGEYQVEFIDSGKTYKSNSASLVVIPKKEKTKQIKKEEPYFFNPEDE